MYSETKDNKLYISQGHKIYSGICIDLNLVTEEELNRLINQLEEVKSKHE